MQFLLADTFTDSLSKLTNEEQKAVKTTVFDLQVDPANPGIQLHRVERVKDKRFWSARVSRDIRLIVHKAKASLLVCFVGHHDIAYDWASRRKLERHPKTGAAQMVLIRERIEEIFVPKYVEQKADTPKPLADITDDKLLTYGIPAEWLADIKTATEDGLLELAELLPSEAAEALLNLAIGLEPPMPVQTGEDDNPFEHPDAMRRFRTMENVEELKQALEFPWEKWSIYLHPAQREVVTNVYSGPARVSGSAGTGKTIVALHRAVHLAKTNPDDRILVTTFSDALSNTLKLKIRSLLEHQPRLGERIEVNTLDNYVAYLYKLRFGKTVIIGQDTLVEQFNQLIKKQSNNQFSTEFVLAEWERVVDAWHIHTWEEYKEVKRLGRRTRLSETHRAALWEIFEGMREYLAQQNVVTTSQMYHKLYDYYDSNPFPIDFVVVDEAQDISVAQLRLLSRLSGKTDGLFFAGDIGQRIFQQPFSWASLGVEIRGRSKTLSINYRTSHQIRFKADKLLAPQLHDDDGIVENRRSTISVFNGPQPNIFLADSEETESDYVAKWIGELIAEGVEEHEIAVFVRSDSELTRARITIEKAGLNYTILDGSIKKLPETLIIGTMHLAKGMEFRAVVVMACDDEVIPSVKRIEETDDLAELEHIYDMERHLLYVACTRARDHLLITGLKPGSEFLADMQN